MSHFAIIVTVKVKPGTAAAFKPIILENAGAAVRDEPDCHRFEVLVDEDDPNTFFFYEQYTDAAALDTHRETPHYKTFRSGTADMIVERTIQRCRVLT